MRIPLVRRRERAHAEAPSCHGGPQADTSGLPLIAIVGQPNVGKSVLFNALTGAYVTVSNYPGTTVEVARGKGRVGGRQFGIVDTPGMYQLLPVTEEERVARHILLSECPSVVVHVVDAKNIERMLPMTLQLIEAGLPVMLDLNLMDEAERAGVHVNPAALERELGIPVVATALTTGRGVAELKERIAAGARGPACAGCPETQPRAFTEYPSAIEKALRETAGMLRGAYPLSGRAMASLLLQRDAEVTALVRSQEGDAVNALSVIAESVQDQFSEAIPYLMLQHQRRVAQRVLGSAVTQQSKAERGLGVRLSHATMDPRTGIPIVLVTLVSLYLLVGVLGAQILVNFLENWVFGLHVNPWVDQILARFVPWQPVRDLVGGQYGVITLGVRYAAAIILPIVGTFFLAFSVIEDSGYLPRLAMLIDRVFKRIGLNGRAVIPMVLGFGCGTMATIVTRTLETKRERVLSTLLLSLAIPCSAQLGVMLGLLGGRPALFLIWASIVACVFLLVGFLAARLMPGERPTFYMELPPLRLPTLGNVLVKTYTRMEWYFREVFPLFLIASVIIWVGRLTGLFDVVVNALVPFVRWLGLPDQTAVAFLFGFFRRDYGAAGLYDLRSVMSGVQLVVATTTITLFVPCIAQFSVALKERGWKTALAINAFIFPFAFLVGGALSHLLLALGVTL